MVENGEEGTNKDKSVQARLFGQDFSDQDVRKDVRKDVRTGLFGSGCLNQAFFQIRLFSRSG